MATRKELANPPATDSPEGSDEGRGNQGPLRLHEVLEEEYVRLHGPLPPGYAAANPTPQQRLSAICTLIHALPEAERRSALCISGGGIRSATFALGVLQGLARAGLLGKFHYLSTVSGGGYIGSWLSSWIHRTGIGQVVSELAGESVSATAPEPKPVRHLRSYSNYLSPKLGLLSADSWTLAAIYIRNLFLNWLVLVPFLAAALMVPRIYAAALRQVTDPAHQPDSLMLIVGAVLGIVAVAYIGLNRPAVRKDQGWGQATYLWACLLPLTLAAILVSLYWATYYTHYMSANANADASALLPYFIIFGLAINVFGYLLWVIVRRSSSARRIFGELAAAGITGLTSGWLLWMASTASFFFSETGKDISLLTYTCLAVPLTLGIFLLSAFLYNGLISFWTSDDDREWWSRSDAWVLLVIVCWAAFSALVIFGPIWLHNLYVGTIGGVSGVTALLLGKSGDTPANEKKSDPPKGLTATLKQYALKLAAPLFLIFILILLAAGTSYLFYLALTSDFFVRNFLHRSTPEWSFSYQEVIRNSPIELVALGLLVLLLISSVVACFININRYS
ncbi:MAG TPA: patatin-like phospholipase family protein, partial [Blastocatellia bacterium]|nr:patatin-like phospholipase family protein [Blastocatellia bacterium]